jgi:hypothetical protein
MRRRGRIRSLSWGVALLALAALLAAVAHGEVDTARAPKALVEDLDGLHREITRLTRIVNPSGHQLGLRAHDIAHEKAGLFQRYFTQPLYGVPASDLFTSFDCIDVKVAEAAEAADHREDLDRAGFHEAEKATRRLIALKLRHANDCAGRLEDRLRASAAAVPPAPVLQPVHAVFHPSTGSGCAPPACSTVYTLNATGEGLTYRWTVSIPYDEECATGFKGGTPQPNQATWYHADASEGGPCNHSGNTYDARGDGHPGLVTVTVTDENWTCVATYSGTQGPSGAPEGDGPPPGPCQQNG